MWLMRCHGTWSWSTWNVENRKPDPQNLVLWYWYRCRCNRAASLSSMLSSFVGHRGFAIHAFSRDLSRPRHMARATALRCSRRQPQSHAARLQKASDGGLRTARHVSCTLPAAHWPPTDRIHARRRAPPPLQEMRPRHRRGARGAAVRGRRLHERAYVRESALSAAGPVQHRRPHRDRLHGGVVPNKEMPCVH